MTAEINFNERIRKYGFRVTPQRGVIIRAIWDSGEHASIDKILAAVALHAPEISPATVYRTLDLFIKRHLVIATRLGDKTVYEIASEHPHHHLMCRACGFDQRIDHQIMKQLIEDIDQEYDFMVESEHVILLGVCGHCRSEAGKGEG